MKLNKLFSSSQGLVSVILFVQLIKRMKKIITCALFYQFLVAIDSFSPLSELTAIKEVQLKKDSKIGKCKHQSVI